MNKIAKRQIRNLLIVISSGVLGAFALVGWMLYYYGPSGRYDVSSTLLAPEYVEHLSFVDSNTKTGVKSRFTFEDVLFSYYDPAKKEWKKISVDADSYKRFYKLIASEKSLENVPPEIISLFNQQYISTLVLKIQTESKAAWQQMSKVFQEVQFANQGDYFRVELRGLNLTDKWAYFYYPKIDQEAINIFTKKE